MAKAGRPNCPEESSDMDSEQLLPELITQTPTRIVMLVMDGLGGLPFEPGGRTELETARTPHLDRLAGFSALGLSEPVGPGITVESGPGHLALFGFDPLQNRLGRGVLEAIGVGIELGPDDLAARGNFCSVDAAGVVTDRRAGRVATEISRELAKRLCVRIEDVDFRVETVREHRLAVVLRGPGLHAAVSGSDPQKNGHAPLPIRPTRPEGEKTARVLNGFLEHARQVLQAEAAANMLLLRGFDKYPHFPSFVERYGLRSAAIAVHHTYRGIAQLVGMQVLPFEGMEAADEFAALEKNWNDFDFFYLHIKNTDLAGEDGDFERKVRVIEEVDGLIPRLMALNPDVVVVTGDHSTPAVMKGHSWHPVPLLIYGKHVRADAIPEFGESACARGNLGILPARQIMPIALANAGRIMKWGG
jgi:2,3-bisphosphoglycerate-independent phosphoglycerate mutase